MSDAPPALGLRGLLALAACTAKAPEAKPSPSAAPALANGSFTAELNGYRIHYAGGSEPEREDSDRGLAAVRADLPALREHLKLGKVNVTGWSNGAINLADGLPNAQFLVFEKSGHSSPVEEPEGFKAAVYGFLGVGTR